MHKYLVTIKYQYAKFEDVTEISFKDMYYAIKSITRRARNNEEQIQIIVRDYYTNETVFHAYARPAIRTGIWKARIAAAGYFANKKGITF